jgi:hypothetical protein
VCGFSKRNRKGPEPHHPVRFYRYQFAFRQPGAPAHVYGAFRADERRIGFTCKIRSIRNVVKMTVADLLQLPKNSLAILDRWVP